jgi:hypothetical protein
MLAQDRSDHGFRHVKGETHRILMIGGGVASKSNMRRVQAKQAVKSSIRAVTLLSNPIVVDGWLGFDEFSNHIGTEINSAPGRLAGSWRFGTNLRRADPIFLFTVFRSCRVVLRRNHPASKAAPPKRGLS